MQGKIQNYRKPQEYQILNLSVKQTNLLNLKICTNKYTALKCLQRSVFYIIYLAYIVLKNYILMRFQPIGSHTQAYFHGNR